jgi:hypothetical protein
MIYHGNLKHFHLFKKYLLEKKITQKALKFMTFGNPKSMSKVGIQNHHLEQFGSRFILFS